MTHFEYLIVAFSILIAMALARLLEGLVHAVRAQSGYWIHSSWLVLVFMNALMLWWVLWELSEAEWTLYTFLTLLAGPVLIFVQAAVLVPLDPNVINNWRVYFRDNARLFFLVRAVAVIQTVVAGRILTDVLPSRSLILGPLMAAVFVSAAFIRNERYQTAVVVFSFLVLAAGVPTLVHVTNS